MNDRNLTTKVLFPFLSETLEKEMKKIEVAVSNIVSSGFSSTNIQTRGVQQALKAICSLLGNMEPLDISRSLMDFMEVCSDMCSCSSKVYIIQFWRFVILFDNNVK